MRHGNVEQQGFQRLPGRPRRFHSGLTWLVAGLGLVAGAHAHGAKHHPTAKAAASTAYGNELAMQVNNDRLTLIVTRVPQVYLYGQIDAGAPQRFQELVDSGKVPAESDIYLNSSSGDLEAGMALGRIFRKHAMVTHLGTPRRAHAQRFAPTTASCVGACAYAYLGGLYRWAPTGTDRVGFKPYRSMPQQTSERVEAYLKEMDVQLGRLVPILKTSDDPVAWLRTDWMLEQGLANNGRQPIIEQHQFAPPAPSLTLTQVDRKGEHRLTFECRPGVITLTTYEQVGASKARDIVRRGTRSYFQINRQENLPNTQGAQAEGDAVTMRQTFAPTRLGHLVLAYNIGSWVEGRTSAFRSGYTFEFAPVREALKDYYGACLRAAPWKMP